MPIRENQASSRKKFFKKIIKGHNLYEELSVTHTKITSNPIPIGVRHHLYYSPRIYIVIGVRHHLYHSPRIYIVIGDRHLPGKKK